MSDQPARWWNHLAARTYEKVTDFLTPLAMPAWIECAEEDHEAELREMERETALDAMVTDAMAEGYNEGYRDAEEHDAY